MESTLVELLTRALHSVYPLMGDGSRAVTDEFCELCRATGLHTGVAMRCDCWCHPARAALKAAGAPAAPAPGRSSSGASPRKRARGAAAHGRDGHGRA